MHGPKALIEFFHGYTLIRAPGCRRRSAAPLDIYARDGLCSPAQEAGNLLAGRAATSPSRAMHGRLHVNRYPQ